MSDKPESVRLCRDVRERYGRKEYDGWHQCDLNGCPVTEHADFVPLAALRKAEALRKEDRAFYEAALRERGELAAKLVQAEEEREQFKRGLEYAREQWEFCQKNSGEFADQLAALTQERDQQERFKWEANKRADRLREALEEIASASYDGASNSDGDVFNSILAITRAALASAPTTEKRSGGERFTDKPPAVDAGEKRCGHSSHDYDPQIERFDCCGKRGCTCKCVPAPVDADGEKTAASGERGKK
jgi:hypothetical protein